MEQHALKKVNNCLNTNIYLETSGGQGLNLHLNVVHFLNTDVNQLISLRQLFSCIDVKYMLLY
jgi:hypothetical protein